VKEVHHQTHDKKIVPASKERLHSSFFGLWLSSSLRERRSKVCWKDKKIEGSLVEEIQEKYALS